MAKDINVFTKASKNLYFKLLEKNQPLPPKRKPNGLSLI